jgi:hypothetical protein
MTHKGLHDTITLTFENVQQEAFVCQVLTRVQQAMKAWEQQADREAKEAEAARAHQVHQEVLQKQVTVNEEYVREERRVREAEEEEDKVRQESAQVEREAEELEDLEEQQMEEQRQVSFLCATAQSSRGLEAIQSLREWSILSSSEQHKGIYYY